jgi:regulator of protease activity HflC (stomatin/prohibitin superfamily)
MHLVFGALAVVVLLFLAGTKVVSPTGRGLVERLGKYRRIAMKEGHHVTARVP